MSEKSSDSPENTGMGPFVEHIFIIGGVVVAVLGLLNVVAPYL